MGGVQGQNERLPEDVPSSNKNPLLEGARCSRGRQWLLRLILAFGGPLLFLGLCEGALRLAGYGYSTRFLIQVPGQAAYTGNVKFAWRFTPAKGAPEPEPFLLPSVKAPGTCRIFILGESAALGVPDPAFGFSRILQVMLAEQYPQTRFEIINAAMMGINSHAILPIARECARFQPDLFVIYMGNNEVCGFFGPMTVATGKNLLSTGTIRASLFAKSARLGQWLGQRGSALYDEPQDMAGFLKHQVHPMNRDIGPPPIASAPILRTSLPPSRRPAPKPSFAPLR